MQMNVQTSASGRGTPRYRALEKTSTVQKKLTVADAEPELTIRCSTTACPSASSALATCSGR